MLPGISCHLPIFIDWCMQFDHSCYEARVNKKETRIDIKHIETADPRKIRWLSWALFVLELICMSEEYLEIIGSCLSHVMRKPVFLPYANN